jgi:hypothetical protein
MDDGRQRPYIDTDTNYVGFHSIGKYVSPIRDVFDIQVMHTNTWIGICIIFDGPIGQSPKRVLAETKINIAKLKKIIKTGEDSKELAESFSRDLRCRVEALLIHKTLCCHGKVKILVIKTQVDQLLALRANQWLFGHHYFIIHQIL